MVCPPLEEGTSLFWLCPKVTSPLNADRLIGYPLWVVFNNEILLLSMQNTEPLQKGRHTWLVILDSLLWYMRGGDLFNFLFAKHEQLNTWNS